MTYFKSLVERVSLAVNVPYHEVRLGEWKPLENDCHGNVDYWVQHHAKTKAVRGWLFWRADEAGQYMFIAHSVIDDDGELVDITPIDPRTPRDGLLFLRHEGTELEFSALKTRFSQSVYPAPTIDEWRQFESTESEESDQLD